MSTRPDPAPSALREVWDLAWPAMLHLSVLTSVFVSDRLLVGRVDPIGLAAMHGGATISWTVASVLGAVAVAALALVGGHAGAERRRQADAATTAALIGTLALGLAVAGGLWLARSLVLRALFPTLGAAAHHEASRYLAVVLPALPLGVVATTAASCLHARRDTRTPMMAALVGCGLNVAVSAALVLGMGGLPRLGVTGAAIGTAIAFVVQAAWLAPRLSWRARPLPWRTLWRLARPVFAERLSFHASYLFYAGFVGLLGPAAMSAHQGLLGVEAFGFTIAEGFGVAAAALAANHLGAGRRARAQATTRAAIGAATASLTAYGALMVVGHHGLVSWLCCDEAVLGALNASLPIAAATQPLVAVAVVACAALRGSGATTDVLAITLAGAVVIRLLVCHLVLPDMGLRGAWMAATFDWLFQAGAAVFCLRRAHEGGSAPTLHDESALGGGDVGSTAPVR